ncbi:hypothetical protein CY0110_17557 [Crocosphaera chwakensis CCY0110]|uniref:Uncharacterized protein n=1 Tax=Crocosphaera chwakensis CCY0110 TaxID=391612 RepID=A3IIJ3_9CHRO|nr:hypothetical protein CY0110_17557 [Crocosphaera chwakensis CCY0110]
MYLHSLDHIPTVDLGLIPSNIQFYQDSLVANRSF